MIPPSSAAWRLRCGFTGCRSSIGRGRPLAMVKKSRRIIRCAGCRRWCSMAAIESTVILDYLDELAGPEKAMIAESGPERRRGLKICALATGLGDKGVSLLYERVLRKDQSKIWVERCEAQIGAVLEVLEKERAAIASPYWFGERIGHADIAVACALRFTTEAHPQLFNAARYPALAAHAARCEALPPFKEIVQPLAPPGAD